MQAYSGLAVKAACLLVMAFRCEAAEALSYKSGCHKLRLKKRKQNKKTDIKNPAQKLFMTLLHLIDRFLFKKKKRCQTSNKQKQKLHCYNKRIMEWNCDIATA